MVLSKTRGLLQMPLQGVPGCRQARLYSIATTRTTTARARATLPAQSSLNLGYSTNRITSLQLHHRPRPRQQARLLHALAATHTRHGRSFSSIVWFDQAIQCPSPYSTRHGKQKQSRRHASSSTSSPSPSPNQANKPIGPKAIYADRVSKGLLKEDPRQLIILEDLQRLYDQVIAYKPPQVPEPLDTSSSAASSSSSSSFVSPDEEATSTTFASLLNTLFGSKKKPAIPVPPIPDDVPKSLYLFGDVGCGKSMLMDLLYESLPESLGKKRVHFHAFMIDVHKKLHKIAADAESTGISQKGDAIVPVARELAREGRVLCFDEFQVTDIADAMILRRLMESMIGYGFVIIITSNRAPDDLYKNGIQRKSFIPCITLIKERFEVQDLDSDIDYRKLPRALSKVYYDPISPENRLEFHKVFEGFTGGRPIVRDRILEVWGRKLRVPQSSAEETEPSQSGSNSGSALKKTTKSSSNSNNSRESVAHFTFNELCGHALSAADYLEIVRHFDTVFISDIPQLTLSDKDKARRFITFIDAAYDNKTRLLTLSSVPITQVFSDAPEAKNPDEGYSPHQRAMMDDLGLDAGTIGASSIFTGDEEIFAFARAVSRLTEMGTRHWAERAGTM